MARAVSRHCLEYVVVPFKANAESRHHIPKQRHRVTNSAAYDAALRQRGSLTVWFTDAAIAAWKAEPRTTRGGQLGLTRFRGHPEAFARGVPNAQNTPAVFT